MYCSKCGTQLANDTIFCSACGQPTGIAAPMGTAGAVPGIGAPGYPTGVIAGGEVARYTPTGVMIVPSPYAGFWLRLLAYLIDHVVLGVIFAFVALVAIAGVGIGYFRSIVRGVQDGNGEFPFALISTILFALLIIFAVSWIYHAWMESSQYQGTLGKMALGLTVTDLMDQRITFGRASGRFFARIVSNLIPFEIGYIMAGFTEKKQALHDMIASCLVLRKR
jgi:uncharacterized RDD family membrane protein YckC